MFLNFIMDRFSCFMCGKGFGFDFLHMREDGRGVCLFCHMKEVFSGEIVELRGRIAKFVEGQEVDSRILAVDVQSEERNTVLAERVDNVESRMVRVESLIQEDGFKVVRNGCKGRREDRTDGVRTENRFSVLGEDVEDEVKVTLVGDSIVRHQDKEFCRGNRNRSRVCHPGANIRFIADRIGEIQRDDSEYVVVHVGTNDVGRHRSEEVIGRYRELIDRFKAGKGRLVVSGMLPRFDVGKTVLSRMIGINDRVQEMCRQEERVSFVDFWEDFSRDRSLFGRDGLHLSQVGAARFGRLLDGEIKGIQGIGRQVQEVGPPA